MFSMLTICTNTDCFLVYGDYFEVIVNASSITLSIQLGMYADNCTIFNFIRD